LLKDTVLRDQNLPSVGGVLGIFLVRIEWENETRESVKWLKGEKLGIEDVLIIWTRQVDAKSENWRNN
jgi:hypothetical protein